MSEAAITTAIITIACVICAVMLISAIYPAMHRATSSVITTSAKLGERIETSVEIVAEANETSYEYVWVKNTGSSQLAPSDIECSDIFFGETVKITINCSSNIGSGDYYFKIVLYNGVSDEDTFSI